MKKCLLLTLLMLLICVSAAAEGFNYRTLPDGTLEITGHQGKYPPNEIPQEIGGVKVTAIGEGAFMNRTDLGYLYIPEGIKTIGDFAFYGCVNMSHGGYPDGLESIGDSAFYGCEDLNEGAYLPESLTHLGDRAFYGCTDLEIVDLPDSIKEVGEGVFYGCTALKEVWMWGQERIGKEAFGDCTALEKVELPYDLTTLGDYAFAGCTGLKEVRFREKVTQIGQMPFGGAPDAALTVTPGTYPEEWAKANDYSVILALSNDAFYYDLMPDGRARLRSARTKGSHLVVPAVLDGHPVFADESFHGFYRYTQVTVEEGITSLPDSCFRDCDELEKVILPQSLTSLGSRCFADCTALKEVNRPDGLVNVPDDIFEGAGISDFTSVGAAAAEPAQADQVQVVGIGAVANIFKTAQTPKGESVPDYETRPQHDGTLRLMRYNGKGGKVVIPAQIDGIQVTALHNIFEGRDDITEVVIPEGVSVLGIGVFKNCTGLAQVTLPSSINEVGQEAFAGCVNLKSVTLPDNIFLFGRDVFKGCVSLAVNLNPGTRTYTTLQREGLVQ